MKFPVPRRRFRDGDRVRSTVFMRVFPGAPPEDNDFIVRGDGELYEKLVAVPEKKTHRRQRRVRWLGGVLSTDKAPTFLYEDELERIVERKVSAALT